MKFEPCGVNPALVTPFDKDEEIDENGFRTLIGSVLPHVDGIVPCGTTGEFVYLSMEERKRLIDIAVSEVNSEIPVIAGTGCCSTRETIELTRYAYENGASAALVVGPYYLTPADKGFHRHFREIADSCPIPVILYNIPQVTGSYIPRRVIEDLAEIDNIVGLKDSSGNLTYTLEILDRVREKINVLIGHDEVVLPALAAGCKGMILASAQVFPDIWQKLYRAVNGNDLGTARELQMKVQKLARIYCRLGGSVPVKASLRMMGIPVGHARKPLMEGGSILHEDISEIRIELEKLGKVETKGTDFQMPSMPPDDSFQEMGIDRALIDKEGMQAATATVGAGYDAIRVDMIAGEKSGTIGKVFAYQLTYPRHGYEALTTILEPNLAVRPSTLIIPGTRQKNLRQANMIFGPVQSSSAKAIADAVEDGTIERRYIDDTLMMARVFLHPSARDRRRIYRNGYDSFRAVLKNIFSKYQGGV